MKFEYRIGYAVKVTGITVAILWGVFFLDIINQNANFMRDIKSFGILPRQIPGLIGVLVAPFIHGNLFHLVGNSVLLALSMFLVFLLYPRKAWELSFTVVFIGGLLVWLVARKGLHIGASGVIFGYIGFLVAAGLTGKRIVPFLLSLIILFLYGGTLLTGLMPTEGISWEGHLAGALSGMNYAWFTRKKNY
ncbi:MAG: rhomboid family intramembrane serine protease [Deltaproteobacteria bacterium]|nr:rhomboid family intramembrane serine protease [Deltaproteobacteria bacterium]